MPQLTGRTDSASMDRRSTEADRLMTVCNSCRYCEGLCAVFPAMEMRRTFPDGDLNYLANLCHGCGACYVDCQFSPPHEFNVNVPRVLCAGAGAILRRLCLAARAVRPVFERNGLAISLIAALSVAAFIARLRRLARPGGAVRRPHRAGRLLPADAAQRDGRCSSARRSSTPSSRSCMGMRTFWRDIGEPAATLAEPAPLWQAMKDAGNAALSRWRRRRLLQRGRRARPTGAGSITTSRSTASCSASPRPAWRRFYHYLLGREAPYAWYDLPVVLGTLGGIGLIVGPVGLLAAKMAARSRRWRTRRASAWMWPSSAMLFLTSLTGLALLVLRETPAMGAAARAASRRGVRAVPHHALRQIRARHLPLPRPGPLCQGEAVAGRQARIALSCRRATPPGSSRASAER